MSGAIPARGTALPPMAPCLRSLQGPAGWPASSPPGGRRGLQSVGYRIRRTTRRAGAGGPAGGRWRWPGHARTCPPTHAPTVTVRPLTSRWQWRAMAWGDGGRVRADGGGGQPCPAPIVNVCYSCSPDHLRPRREPQDCRCCRGCVSSTTTTGSTSTNGNRLPGLEPAGVLRTA